MVELKKSTALKRVHAKIQREICSIGHTNEHIDGEQALEQKSTSIMQIQSLRVPPVDETKGGQEEMQSFSLWMEDLWQGDARFALADSCRKITSRVICHLITV